MSLTTVTAAIMKTIHDIILSHPFIVLILVVFALSTLLSVLLVAVFVNNPDDPASSSIDEEAGGYAWWNSGVPRYSPLPGSDELRLTRAFRDNSPLEISRQESELLSAVHREYMRDDLKRLVTLESELRGE